MSLPSGLQAHEVTLVLAPRSFDRTTMTCFCFHRSLRSQILHVSDRSLSTSSSRTYRNVESFEHVRNRSLFVGCHDPPLISAVCPLCVSSTRPTWLVDPLRVLHVTQVHITPNELFAAGQLCIRAPRITHAVCSSPSRPNTFACSDPEMINRFCPSSE